MIKDWHKALKAKDYRALTHLLEKNFMPSLPTANWEKKQLQALDSAQLITWALENHRYNLADQLLLYGVPLPEMKQCLRANHTTSSSYYRQLIDNSDELFIATRKTPALLNTEDEQGRTLLHYAAEQSDWLYQTRENRHLATILRLLVETSGSDLNRVDHNGFTALHLLVQETQGDSLALWLRAGGTKWCFSRPNPETSSALEYAIAEKKWSVAMQLIQTDANPSGDGASPALLDVLKHDIARLEQKMTTRHPFFSQHVRAYEDLKFEKRSLAELQYACEIAFSKQIEAHGLTSLNEVMYFGEQSMEGLNHRKLGYEIEGLNKKMSEIQFFYNRDKSAQERDASELTEVNGVLSLVMNKMSLK